MKKNSNILSVIFLLGISAQLMSMVRKSMPVLKKNVSIPTQTLGAFGKNVVLYGDEAYKEYLREQQLHADLMDDYARKQGWLNSHLLEPEIVYPFNKDSFKDIAFGKDLVVTSCQNNRFEPLASRPKKFGVLDLEIDTYGDSDIEAVELPLRNARIGDVVKNIKIKDVSNIELVINQLEKAKADCVYQIMQSFGVKDKSFNKNDVIKFLNLAALKGVSGFMGIRISDAFKLLRYDGLSSFEKGLQSNNSLVQIMALRTFLMPVSMFGIPSCYPFSSMMLANAFSHALCEMLVGRSLTDKEFKEQRALYGDWFYALEKTIVLAFWIATVYVSIKVVHVVYHDVQKQNDELRMNLQQILLEALQVR